MVNKIELEIQKINTQLANIHSLAKAEVIKFRGKKESQLAQSYIEAFGSPEAYNAYTFLQQTPYLRINCPLKLFTQVREHYGLI